MIFTLRFHIVMGNEFFAHFCRTVYMKAELGKCIQTSPLNRICHKEKRESLIMFSFWENHMDSPFKNWCFGPKGPMHGIAVRVVKFSIFCMIDMVLILVS